MEVARTLDDESLNLIGYQEAGFDIGYFRDSGNPIHAVRGNNYGDFELSSLAEGPASKYNYMSTEK